MKSPHFLLGLFHHNDDDNFVVQSGDPGSSEHQEGGAHQYQLLRPHVGNLQPSDSSW